MLGEENEQSNEANNKESQKLKNTFSKKLVMSQLLNINNTKIGINWLFYILSTTSSTLTNTTNSITR